MTRTCRHPQESAYERDLDRNDANFAALTPLGFLERSADIYPGRTAVIHGPLKRTYGELRQRCRRLASALARRGIVPGDTVSIIAPNIPAMVEVHYGVPMAGAVLNALNYRLDAATLAYILDHSETRILFADSEFAAIVREALSQVQRPVEVIDIDDPEAGLG